MPQISTTGQLENASREMIGKARYTAEFNAPIYATVSHFTLKQGEDTGVFPKVGQMSMANLTEGQDITTEQDIGLTSVSVTTGEVGAKVVLTDKLLRQNVAANWQMVGRQLGDGYRRKREEDLRDLFSALNGGTTLGAAGAAFSAANATGVVSIAKTNRYGDDLVIVHHPNAVMRLARDLSTIGSGQMRPLPEGYSSRLLGKAWSGYKIWDVPVFETGNITRDASDDAIGAIYNPDAMGILESKSYSQERQRSAPTRAWLLVVVADYAAFELDDTRGAPLTYDAVNPSTSA